MKKTIIILTAAMLLALFGTATAQEMKIPGTELSITLPTDNWRYLQTMKLDDGADLFIFYYSHETIIDETGDTILPFLRMYVNKGYKDDIYTLIYSRYMLQPYQSIEEYTSGPGLPKDGGLGYIGAYTNPSEQKDYQFMMTYFKNNGTIVEIRLETTKDTFHKMENEFNTILKSLK